MLAGGTLPETDKELESVHRQKPGQVKSLNCKILEPDTPQYYLRGAGSQLQCLDPHDQGIYAESS